MLVLVDELVDVVLVEVDVLVLVDVDVLVVEVLVDVLVVVGVSSVKYPANMK